MKKSLINFIYSTYAFLFARKFMSKMNKLMFNLSIRGMGVLNAKNDKMSGEDGFLKKYISKLNSGVILDVGANVGRYSKMVTDCNKGIKLYSFEPHPLTFEKLKNNVENTNCEPVHAGVGANNEELVLFDYESSDGSSHASLYKGVIEDLRKEKAVEHKVKVIKLDDFVEEKGIEEVRLLKIDTEGNELNVLKGFERFIAAGKVKAIHFEFNEMNIISKTSFKDFWDMLPEYDFYRLLPGGGYFKIKSYSPLMCEIYAFQNVVAFLRN